MIPKVIHYCWFGGKRKPKLIRDCIDSWKTFLPDYDIIEWNEENSDLSSKFVSEAYSLKKWAFVADYIRLKVLYERGGIYLDTDMLVLKTFDDLLQYKCFFGAEDLEFISCGIIGAEKKNIFIEKCIDFYSESCFFDKKKIHLNTIPRIVTKIFNDRYNFNGVFEEFIINDDLAIFPPVFFYPFPFNQSKIIKEYEKFIKKESYAVHLWNSSWIEYSEFYYLRERKYQKGMAIVLRKLFVEKKVSFKYLKKIISCLKESFKK